MKELTNIQLIELLKDSEPKFHPKQNAQVRFPLCFTYREGFTAIRVSPTIYRQIDSQNRFDIAIDGKIKNRGVTMETTFEILGREI